MMNQLINAKFTPPPRSIASILVLLSLIGTALADSARIKSNANNHWYQLFTTSTTWPEAKALCKSKSAHLATIDSQEENGFIVNKLSGLVSYSWIGASDAVQEGKFVWNTGEKWGYTNWQSGYPNTGTVNSDYDYVGITFGSGVWWDDRPSIAYAYLCEWSAPNYIDVTSVPDINSNRFSETAVLYVDFVTGKHTVKIKDPQTQTVLSTLTFLTTFTPPQGLASLADLNGNGFAEIAVLYSELNQPSVGIKDAKTKALIKTLRFLGTTYEPKAITATPDTNGNGSSEITVLGINKTSGQARSETRDSKTGAILKSIAF